MSRWNRLRSFLPPRCDFSMFAPRLPDEARRRGQTGYSTRRPGPLKIESADPSVTIEHLTDYI